jgi:hypothetical protein
MLLAGRIEEQPGIVLAIDIGTNTEICLANYGVLTSASCASGPAFEGAHIKHGMRAAAGAIERLRLAQGHVEYQTIGGGPPAGMCGSGLSAAAQLFLAGSSTGRAHARTPPGREVDGVREFVWWMRRCSPAEARANREGRHRLYPARRPSVQLAKNGAIRTGIELLLAAGKRRAEESIGDHRRRVRELHRCR